MSITVEQLEDVAKQLRKVEAAIERGIRRMDRASQTVAALRAEQGTLLATLHKALAETISPTEAHAITVATNETAKTGEENR